MPFPNEHAARLKAPGTYVRFRRQNDKLGPGIDAIFGVTEDGTAELQAIRFASDKFTAEQARAWLTEHEHKTVSFESAETKGDGLAPGAYVAEDEVLRFDRFDLPGSIKRTDEGFIEADPVVTRTGVFRYRMPDGMIRHELRCDEEVFAEDSLRSARMIPITNTHPESFVLPKNASKLAVGYTGENVRRDGQAVRVPIKVTTEDGITAIEGGRRQLSLGYKCLVERKDGEANGEKYTHVQRRIRYNHLALCDQARAGVQATLRLDAADAIMVEIGQEQSGSRKETKMPGKVRLDSGIEYEVPPEVEAGYSTVTKERSAAVAKHDALKVELDTLQAKHDALTKEKAELEKRDSAEAIAAAAKARVALLSTAAKMVGEDEAKKLDAMTDAEIRVAAIKASDKDFDAKDKSADYLTARFDAAAIVFEKTGAAKKDQGKAVVGDGSRKDADDDDPDKAREAMQLRRDGVKKAEK